MPQPPNGFIPIAEGVFNTPPFLSKLGAMKVGFLPLPLYLVLAAIIYLVPSTINFLLI